MSLETCLLRLLLRNLVLSDSLGDSIVVSASVISRCVHLVVVFELVFVFVEIPVLVIVLLTFIVSKCIRLVESLVSHGRVIDGPVPPLEDVVSDIVLGCPGSWLFIAWCPYDLAVNCCLAVFVVVLLAVLLIVVIRDDLRCCLARDSVLSVTKNLTLASAAASHIILTVFRGEFAWPDVICCGTVDILVVVFGEVFNHLLRRLLAQGVRLREFRASADVVHSQGVEGLLILVAGVPHLLLLLFNLPSVLLTD